MSKVPGRYAATSEQWADAIRREERERIWKWLHVESGHNGQTHWEGKVCFFCRAIRFIREDEA
jgi:hypothetical protein